MTTGSLIIGAGGHGKVVADILLSQNMKVLGFLDDNFLPNRSRILGISVIGKIEEWLGFDSEGLIMAVGDNATRKAIVQSMEGRSVLSWINAFHPNSTVATSAAVGIGTVIAAGGIVNPEATIGKHVIINTGATIDHDCVIGDYVHVGPGVHIAGGVKIGDGALLGIGCSVLPGCAIGRWSTIGAGSVVISNIPDGVIAKGIPAYWNK